jgi:hypothetical protein
MLHKKKNDDQWEIRIGDTSELLKTPNGHIVQSSSEEFIDEILSQLDDYDEIEIENAALTNEPLTDPNFYSLYCGYHDFIKGETPKTWEHIMDDLVNDSVLHRSAGPEFTDQLEAWEFVPKYFNSLGINDDIISSGLYYEDSVGDKDVYEFRIVQGGDEEFIRFKEFTKKIHEHYVGLNGYEKIALNTLVTIFGSTIAALSLIANICDELEFTYAIMPFIYLDDDENEDEDEDYVNEEYKQELIFIGSSAIKCKKFISHMNAEN